MRVADINMTRPNENCPAGFTKVTVNGKTMCGGQSSHCISTTFSTYGVLYTRVCGRIIGYQYGTTDAFSRYIDYGESIDSNFVDGIVLTHGSPHNHIWTFATGINQFTNSSSGCPCNTKSSLPPYIENEYFCERIKLIIFYWATSLMIHSGVVLAVLVAPAVHSTLLRGFVRTCPH